MRQYDKYLFLYVYYVARFPWRDQAIFLGVTLRAVTGKTFASQNALSPRYL